MHFLVTLLTAATVLGAQVALALSPSGPTTSKVENGPTITLWKVLQKALMVSRRSHSKLESNGLVSPPSNFIYHLNAHVPSIDVYQAAAQQGVIVVGGHARTVGAAGGWLTGGGHSAWSNLYGLGVDSEWLT
jgi:hypothetical protein